MGLSITNILYRKSGGIKDNIFLQDFPNMPNSIARFYTILY